MTLHHVSRRALLTGTVSIMALALAPRRALADTAADARGFIDRLAGDALVIIKNQGLPVAEKQKQFSVIFKKAFDVQQIGRFVVGRYWNRATPDDQEKYQALFGDYVAAIYAMQFSNYQGQNFKTTGARANGDTSNVGAQIERQGQPPINIDFRVAADGGNPKIIDVSVEGVSLILTKRDEFSSVLNQEGLPGVMKRMQATLEQVRRA
jgi:phospholipid transport system substrate-binding protein